MRWASRRNLTSFALVVATSAWIAFSNTSTGDFPVDAAPPIHALAGLHLATYLDAQPLMGPFATLIAAPFAALAPAGALAEYQWATLPSLLAAGVLGLYLAGVAGRRGASAPAQALIAALCLVNPISFEAIRMGHPEELLTAALAVAAVAAAADGHDRRGAILLGLAIASKQWAVIAIFPVLLALPARRLRAAGLAAAVAAALMLPALVASPGSFLETQTRAASGDNFTTPWNVWYPFANQTTRQVGSGAAEVTAHLHETPSVVTAVSHPLVVGLALLVPLAVVLRRRRAHLSGPEAMALLSLLALLRCALDPIDNFYYHAPLLLSLIGWDAFATRGLPVRGLAATAIALLFYEWSAHLGSLVAFNAAYIAVVAAAAAAIALLGMGSGRRRKEPWDADAHRGAGGVREATAGHGGRAGGAALG